MLLWPTFIDFSYFRFIEMLLLVIIFKYSYFAILVLVFDLLER